MSEVRTSIEIAASPAQVWRIAMDPERLGDWVTIHRNLHQYDPWPPRAGAGMVQTLVLRGAPFKVRWTLASCRAPTHAEWHGDGPAGSKAQTEYTLTRLGPGRTRFDYRNSFEAPGGPLGAITSRALVGDTPRREADASLKRLRSICESANAPRR